MRVLAIDIGSSSVKAAVLHGPGMPRLIARENFATRYSADEVDVDPKQILRAVCRAIAALGNDAKRVDLIAPTGMAPSWLAMDAKGQPLTPVVTHQDRRSLKQGTRIEKEVGRARHLAITGNRPVPGGISSTTCAWFIENSSSLKRRISLIGHLNSWLSLLLCGTRAIDPSNASFTGLFNTTTLNGWNSELTAIAGACESWLPEVMEGNAICGHLTNAGARRLGLVMGTPMLTGVMDGSCPMLLAGPAAGQVVNVVGSTDVLAVCTDAAVPFDGLLTRALGVGRRWLSVGTVAAAGTAIDWAHRTFFSELSLPDFHRHVVAIGRKRAKGTVFCDARLAGSRTELEPVQATLQGLTVSSTRDEILAALLESLERQSAQRLSTFDRAKIRYRHDVFSTGGGNRELAGIIRRDWPGKWSFRTAAEATARGLWVLSQNVL